MFMKWFGAVCLLLLVQIEPAHFLPMTRMSQPLPPAPAIYDEITFGVVSDQRIYAGAGAYNTPRFFLGAVQALQAAGPIDFIVTPGDIDPPDDTFYTIREVFTADVPWYPVVGNHELPGAGEEAYLGANMEYLRAYPLGAVSPGPSGCPQTTYSFDRGQAHFVVLNEYCTAAGDNHINGDVSDSLYNWLAADLAATDQEFIFIFGHEPAYPQPDADVGVLRYLGGGLDKYPEHRDRFWSLLRAFNVTAYICGHTHTYSAENLYGVWQIDTGHARGAADETAPSTAVVIKINSLGKVLLQTYRTESPGGDYMLKHYGLLNEKIHLPLMMIQ